MVDSYAGAAAAPEGPVLVVDFVFAAVAAVAFAVGEFVAAAVVASNAPVVAAVAAAVDSKVSAADLKVPAAAADSKAPAAAVACSAAEQPAAEGQPPWGNVASTSFLRLHPLLRAARIAALWPDACALRR